MQGLVLTLEQQIGHGEAPGLLRHLDFHRLTGGNRSSSPRRLLHHLSILIRVGEGPRFYHQVHPGALGRRQRLLIGQALQLRNGARPAASGRQRQRHRVAGVYFRTRLRALSGNGSGRQAVIGSFLGIHRQVHARQRRQRLLLGHAPDVRHLIGLLAAADDNGDVGVLPHHRPGHGVLRQHQVRRHIGRIFRAGAGQQQVGFVRPSLGLVKGCGDKVRHPGHALRQRIGGRRRRKYPHRRQDQQRQGRGPRHRHADLGPQRPAKKVYAPDAVAPPFHRLKGNQFLLEVGYGGGAVLHAHIQRIEQGRFEI